MRECNVFKFKALIALISLVWVAVPVFAQGDTLDETRATFRVYKDYNDGNTTPVLVTISCNTGLPLEQTYELDPGTSWQEQHVEFVVTDFTSGNLDCNISERVPDGYEAVYFNPEYEETTWDACYWEEVSDGDIAYIVDVGDDADDDLSNIRANNICAIGNALLPSTVHVNKEWVDDHPEFNSSTFARATWHCDNVPEVDWAFHFFVEFDNPTTIDDDDYDYGHLYFNGNPGYDFFQTYGNWDGGTHCYVEEEVHDSNVESDASDCSWITLYPGQDAACTIVNTRIYEGIPTLSQYGLGVLGMLMLGLGLIGFRRLS